MEQVYPTIAQPAHLTDAVSAPTLEPTITTPTSATALPAEPIQQIQNALTNRLSVPMEYVGVANVVGDCYCFGLATHLKLPIVKYVPVFISVTGAASSVEALWAKLSQGKATSIVPERGPSLPLEPDDKGLYVRFQKKIEGLGIDHLLLVHRDLAEPTYPTNTEPTLTYILWINDAQGEAKLGEHVRNTVKVAVFTEWQPYLHREGRQHGLVKTLTCYGGVHAVAVTLDPVRWTALIAEGLQTKRIHLPA